MRAFLWLAILAVLCLVAQLGPAARFLAPWGRPDVSLLLALPALLFLPRRTAFWLLFVLGLSADAVGSGRLGLLTLSYLLAGGLLSGFEYELVRGGLWTAWLAAVIGTLVAHLSYLILGRWCGLGLEWFDGLLFVAQRGFAAALWGGLAALLLRELLLYAKLLETKPREIRARSPWVRRVREWRERYRRGPWWAFGL